MEKTDGNKKPNQSKRLLEYMKNHDGINQMEAFTDLGITRLSGRIYEMKANAIPIVDTFEEGINRYGESTRYKRYRLGTEDDIDWDFVKRFHSLDNLSERVDGAINTLNDLKGLIQGGA